MAANLAKAGHDLRGFDTAKVSVSGVANASSVEDAVGDADAVITMLPNGEILRAVYSSIIPAAKHSAILIDNSTVDIESARAVAALATDKKILSVDAPVSGGIGGAVVGTLTFMVGGSDAAFLAAEPILGAMGRKIVHCGASGAGQAAKICNNMLLGISMAGVCEMIVLADRLELDRQKLFDVTSTSSGSCWSINNYFPAPNVGPLSPADNGYKPGFAAELMLKDLMLSQQAAENVDAPTLMGELATSLYANFVDGEGRGMDFSALILRLQKLKRSA